MMTLTCIVLTFLAVNFYKMIYSKEALVAEWIHFTLCGIILPTIKLKVYTFWGL